MRYFLGGVSFGFPSGLTIAAFMTASLITWLAAAVCFSVAISATLISGAIRERSA